MQFRVILKMSFSVQEFLSETDSSYIIFREINIHICSIKESDLAPVLDNAGDLQRSSYIAAVVR